MAGRNRIFPHRRGGSSGRVGQQGQWIDPYPGKSLPSPRDPLQNHAGGPSGRRLPACQDDPPAPSFFPPRTNPFPATVEDPAPCAKSCVQGDYRECADDRAGQPRAVRRRSAWPFLAASRAGRPLWRADRRVSVEGAPFHRREPRGVKGARIGFCFGLVRSRGKRGLKTGRASWRPSWRAALRRPGARWQRGADPSWSGRGPACLGAERQERRQTRPEAGVFTWASACHFLAGAGHSPQPPRIWPARPALGPAAGPAPSDPIQGGAGRRLDTNLL